MITDNEKPFFRKEVTDLLFLVCIAILFVYFVIRLVFFALRVPHYLPPDELTHLGLCEAFSHGWKFPENSEDTFVLGEITRIPWFYYYLMGKLLVFNVLQLSNVVFCRFINIVFAGLTVVYGYRWISLLSENKLTKLLFFILLTNTAMFSFLGAAVSYDNLVNLCAVLTLYCTQRFFLSRNITCFLSAVIFLLIGSLTKISFLPLVPIFVCILFVQEKSNIANFHDYINNLYSKLNVIQKILGLISIILLIMCFKLYGTNVLKYHKIIPQPSQLLSEEQFMKNRVVARDYIVNMYRSGAWSYERSVAEVEKMNHPGDKKTTLYLLKLQASSNKQEKELMSRLAYSYTWLNIMLSNTVGIMTHRPMSIKKTDNELAFYQLFFIVSFYFFARYWRMDTAGFLINQSIILVLAYGIFLMQYVNYSSYINNLAPIAVQGRYIFPVIVPFYGIVSYYLTNFNEKRLSLLIIILVAAFYIWGDFPYFLLNTDKAWFG